MNCYKERIIIKTDAAGEKTHLHQCANRSAPTWGTQVTTAACENCVLKQPFPKLTSCGAKLKTGAKYVDGLLVYEVPPQEKPDGYQELSPTTFEPLWHECPGRAFQNEVSREGELVIKAYCSVTRGAVSFEQCQSCQAGTTPASEKRPVPAEPSFAVKAWKYTKAVSKWVMQGRPTRSKEEVETIYQTHCRQCDWFNSTEETCRGCGCAVSTHEMAVFNKIKMGTEKCPKGHW